MQTSIQWTWSWIAAFLPGVVAAIGTVLVLMLTKAGESLVGRSFDRRMKAYEAQLDHRKDRAVRSNEKEYSGLVCVWEAYSKAYGAALDGMNAFTSLPPLNNLTEEKAKAVLLATELSSQQQDQILESTDRDTVFSRTVRYRRIAGAQIACQDAFETLQKNGIFIPDALETQFLKAIELLANASAESAAHLEFGGKLGELTQREKFRREGNHQYANLKAAVRKQLMVDVREV